jgi:hypothetical protein
MAITAHSISQRDTKRGFAENHPRLKDILFLLSQNDCDGLKGADGMPAAGVQITTLERRAIEPQLKPIPAGPSADSYTP